MSSLANKPHTVDSVPKTPERNKSISTIPTPPNTPKKRVRASRPPLVRSKAEMRNRKLRDIGRKLRAQTSMAESPPMSPQPKHLDTGQPKPLPLASPFHSDPPPNHVDNIPDFIDLTKPNTPKIGKKRTPARERSHNTDDAIDISSDTSGEPFYKAPGEKWYYGPSKSRVLSSDPAGPASPPRTRGWRKRTAQPVSSEDEKNEIVHGRSRRLVSGKRSLKSTRPLLKLNYDPSRKRKRGDPLSFDDVLRRHGPLVPRPDYVVPDLSDSSSDLPEPSEVLRKLKSADKATARGKGDDDLTAQASDGGGLADTNAEKERERTADVEGVGSATPGNSPPPKRRRTANNAFILTDVSVEGDEADDSNGGGLFTDDEAFDDYDREDSFIDDTPLETVPIFDIRRSSSPQANASDIEQDDGMPSDEETQFEVAKLQSLFSNLRQHMERKDYESSLREVNRALKKVTKPKVRRGQGNAPPSYGTHTNPSSNPEGKGKGRDTVGDVQRRESTPTMTVEEKEDIEKAIANSLGDYRAQNGLRPPQTPGAGPSGPSSHVQAMVNAVIHTPPSIPTSSLSNMNQSSVGGPQTPAPAPFSMAALVAQTPGASTAWQSEFPDDPSFKPVSVLLPEVDATYDTRLHDVFLGKDYAALPNLPAGKWMPWTNSRVIGPWAFHLWGKLSPEMNALLALAAIRFQDSGAYTNPSRAAPANLQLRDVPAKSPRFHVMRNFKNLYCLTSGLVLSCQLRIPTKGGMRKKEIQIIPYKQEWERLVGWSCLVLDENPLGAQLWRGSIQMSTRGVVDSKPTESSAIAVNPDPAPGPAVDGFSLGAEDEVPIYDARHSTNFNFDTDLPILSSRLPKWDGDELPLGSCVVAGYTMSKYMNNKGIWSVGCNIHWVILFGLPDEAVAKTLLGR
ncbi:hypothetical protein EST38_g9618 [Candolleomyces aberdarensis]|uniref:Uncharacterized protein n=1 Tax=Candolleomyces aberdarensis TaxID=2316362 RepID=A0A4V1Q2T8_9AGAR|nr:hypothetical protein EST38_g9618 [Candolleomyces aberdarensis]